MKQSLKLIIIIALYELFVLIGVVVYFFTIPTYEGILQSDLFFIKLFNSLLFFCKLLPCLFISAVLIGFAWIFGAKEIGKLQRFSSLMMQNLKQVLCVCSVCALLCFVVNEVAIPEISWGINKIQTRATDFDEYIKFAKEKEEIKEYDLALLYVNSALSLMPKSEEANEIYTNLKTIISDKEINKKTIENNESDIEEIDKHTKNAFDFLTIAQKAFLEKEYLKAHYYSTLALNISTMEDPNAIKARILAAQSWNALEKTESYSEGENCVLYNQKTKAYQDLLAGDVIHAYYQFLDLHENYPTDPDVNLYLNESREKLENQCFFIEDAYNLKELEQSGSIWFSLENANKEKLVIYIQGISLIENSGSTIQYLRNLQIIKFSDTGKFLEKCSVPYAKMIAIPLSSLAGMAKKILPNVKEEVYIPYIMLESVSKNAQDKHIQPVYEYADGYENKDSKLNNLILPMTFSDFIMIKEASVGAEKMPLFSLFNFCMKAQQYGYSPEVYFTNLTMRITFPFYMLFIMIFCALIGWNYRLAFGNLFKFRWLLIFPFCSAVVYVLYNLFIYVCKLLYLTLFGLTGMISFYLFLMVFILSVLVMAFVFLCARGE